MKKLMFTMVTLLLFMTFLTGCSSSSTPTQQGGAKPTEVAPVKASGGILAEAAVVPVKNATLSFAAQGIIEDVLVEEGKSVKAGQEIARLSGKEKLNALIAGSDLEMLSAKQDLDNLTKNAEQAKAQAELRLANAEKALDKAKTDRERKDYKRAGQNYIDIASSQYIVAQQAVKDAEEVYNLFANKSEDDINRAAALSALANARQNRDRALANLNHVLGRPDQFEVGVAQGELVVAQAEVDAAKRDLEKVKNGPDPDKKALIEARIKSAQAQIDSAKASLEDLSIIAPFDGVVVVNNLKVGEPVGGTSSTVILADMSNWQIETTDLTELNVINVKVGDPVTVTLDAIPDLELTGKVERIKSLGVNKQGDITYVVVVTLDKQDERLRWNMTASVSFKK